MGMATRTRHHCERLLRIRPVEARACQRQRRGHRQPGPESRRPDLSARLPLVGRRQAAQPQRRHDLQPPDRSRGRGCELEFPLRTRHHELPFCFARSARLFRRRHHGPGQRVSTDDLSDQFAECRRHRSDRRAHCTAAVRLLRTRQHQRLALPRFRCRARVRPSRLHRRRSARLQREPGRPAGPDHAVRAPR